jgi:hypothetical protein
LGSARASPNQSLGVNGKGLKTEVSELFGYGRPDTKFLLNKCAKSVILAINFHNQRVYPKWHDALTTRSDRSGHVFFRRFSAEELIFIFYLEKMNLSLLYISEVLQKGK